MKTIQVRVFAEQTGDGQPVTSLTLFRMALDAPSRDGLTMADIRARLRVHTAIDKAEKIHGEIVSLKLEDSDFVTLAGVWRSTPWTVPSRHLVTVDDDLCAAEKPAK